MATVTDRYADGLPRAIDGTPVMRGAAAVAKAKAMTDDTPFLITGWVDFEPGPRYCALQQSNDTSWLHDCVRATFSDVAGALEPAMTDAVTFRFISDAVVGPVVASVHVHDPRATECGSAVGDCDRLMVVERIVLSGDQAFEPRPLTADRVQRMLRRVQSDKELRPFGPDSHLTGCGDALPGALVYFPALKPNHVPAVSLVEVEPSPRARERALSLGTGAYNALGPKALICGNFAPVDGSSSTTDYRWLAVENVIVLVQTHHGMTPTDRAFMVRVSKALQHAAS